jgi:hypothetical protein
MHAELQNIYQVPLNQSCLWLRKSKGTIDTSLPKSSPSNQAGTMNAKRLLSARNADVE